MTKEHLNEIMASLCKKLMIDKSDLVAIHEAALVALGIDSNAVPYGLDFLVLRGLGDAGVSKLSIDGFDIRLHAPENFEANGPISLVAPRGMDFPSLAPETILETISKSPSCRYLMEQRAALAELLGLDTGALTVLAFGFSRLASIRLSAMVLMDAFRKTAIALKGTNQPIKTIRGQR